MPDDRTQDALDALADLFLTGLIPPAPSETEEATAQKAKRRGIRRAPDKLEGPAPIRLGPKVRHAAAPADDVAVSPEEGIDPLEIIERATNVLASAGVALDDEAAAAPYLRLRRDEELAAGSGIIQAAGPGGADSATEPPAAPSAETPSDPAEPLTVLVEGVILGNLPGFGGAWLTQYAGLLAQQDGPVAVVHVGDETIDLELIEPYDDERPEQDLPKADDAVELLETLARRAEAPVRTVLMHFDANPDSLGDGGIDRLMSVDAWTVLAGADDAAVVGVYRTLKLLVDSNGDAAHKRVGLMVMGSDEEDSRAAADRVRTASDEFLHTPVQLIGWQKRMVPVAARDLGTFENLVDLWPRLAAWLDTLVQPELEVREEPIPTPAAANRAAARPEPPTEPVPAPDARAQPEPQPKRPAVEPLTPRIKTTIPPKPARRPAATPPATARPATASPRPDSGWRRELAEQIVAGRQSAGPAAAAPNPKPRPAPAPRPAAATPRWQPATDTPPGPARPTPAPAPAAAATLGEPDLAALIATHPGGIPGGIALEARCPHQPTIQLVLDQEGRLHLLGRALPTLNAAAEAAPDAGVAALRASIVDLLEVRDWAREHLALLQLTQRQVRLDPDHMPRLHLFTDRADLAVPLAHRLGKLLKLHLLQEVRVGSQATWFSTPLC